MSNTNKTEEKVKVKLPLTRTEKEPVYVARNGHTYRIKRGIEVEVPVGIAKILKRKEDMLVAAMDYEESVADKNEE